MWAEKYSSVPFLKYISLNAIHKVNGEEDEEFAYLLGGGGGGRGWEDSCMRHQLVPANTHSISLRERANKRSAAQRCRPSPRRSARRKNYIIETSNFSLKSSSRHLRWPKFSRFQTACGSRCFLSNMQDRSQQPPPHHPPSNLRL